MKKIFCLFLILVALSGKNIAVEGMWVPLYLDKFNIEDMQKKGLKISADDIYSVNNTSLKDAVVIFGRGCTGSVISETGLILTNHHCGYGQIQNHSSIDNDIIADGFWATNHEEELPNPGLTVRFLVEMSDVTDFILDGVKDNMTEREREEVISENSKILIDSVKDNSHYTAEVKAFFSANQYMLIVNEVFSDVRLVGAPPYSIGKFGGDTDNWEWPRHTGDFALFRVYTAPDGTPAEYSEENIPLKARKHLKISSEGVSNGDFTFVYGYPGSTTQYIPSYAVKHIKKEVYPTRIKVRDKKLNIIKNAMDKDREVGIQYAVKAARISNAWKKWIGEIRGLRKLNAINVKKEFETHFMDWVSQSEDRQKQYGNILAEYKNLFQEYAKYNLAFYYYHEAGLGTDAIKFASDIRRLEKLKHKDRAIMEALKSEIREIAQAHFRDYNTEVDKDLFKEMLKVYLKYVPEEFQPAYYNNININECKHKAIDEFADMVFERSILTNQESFDKFIDNLSFRSYNRLKKDPIYIIMKDFRDINSDLLSPKIREFRTKSDSLNRIYMRGILEFETEKVLYPDANFTLRLSYGKVEPYSPFDGADYNYFTSLTGVIEKASLGKPEYYVKDKLKELFFHKDFGTYAHEDGSMRVCFIASNHTTGGNSGSPVFNGNGHLVGLNFDRNWEGTMSDIMFDPDRNRNISVDIRYVLFIIDKFANASHIIDELSIISKLDSQ